MVATENGFVVGYLALGLACIQEETLKEHAAGGTLLNTETGVYQWTTTNSTDIAFDFGMDELTLTQFSDPTLPKNDMIIIYTRDYIEREIPRDVTTAAQGIYVLSGSDSEKMPPF